MKLCRLQLKYTAVDTLNLPPYKGATFRGSLGHIFKDLVCVKPHRQCEGCELQESCLYPRTFQPVKDSKHPLPPPYIIEPPAESKQHYTPGETFAAGLVLVGERVASLPYFIQSMAKLGVQGIGKGGGEVQLRSVLSLGMNGSHRELLDEESGRISDSAYFVNWEDFTPTDTQEVTLRFLTPVQLQHKGKLIKGPIPFRLLVTNLLRRWKMLERFYGDGKNSTPWELERQEVGSVVVSDFDVQWQSFSRWSNRQKRYHPLYGLTGSVTYEGDLTPWTPLLQLGEWMHLGKKTSFGLGQYELKCGHV